MKRSAHLISNSALHTVACHDSSFARYFSSYSLSLRSGGKLPHHGAEFIILYFSVSVVIDLCNERVQMLVTRLNAKRLSDFIWGDRTTAILVEQLEG